MGDEVTKLLREWDESRGISPRSSDEGTGEEKVCRAGPNLRFLMRLKSFEPYKRSAPRNLEGNKRWIL